MINVQVCCNEDNGIFTGRVTRVDFNDYELTVEDTLWPQRGIALAFTPNKRQGFRRGDTLVRFGRDIWRESLGLRGFGGNIFWRNIQMPGVECFGLMNYLSSLKYWHATEGECYLFDRFNAKQPIVPKEFFASRQEQASQWVVGPESP